MTRWRLVTEQDGNPPQVSTVVLSEEEAREQLAGEALLHSMAGWAVTVGVDVIVCRKLTWPGVGTVRAVRRVEFDAMHDHMGATL